MKYRLHCDGAVTKNPGGEASYGFVLQDENRRIDFGYGIIGSGANMNSVMAECFAISQGLSSFIRYWDQPKSSLYIYNDSKFVLSQLKKESQSFPFQLVVFQLQQINSFIDVNLVWIPRSGNTLADLLTKRLRKKSELLQAYSDKDVCQ